MHGHVCQDTEKLIDLDRMLLDVEQLLNAANVPRYESAGSPPMTLAERIRELVSQRDEARRLSEQTAREHRAEIQRHNELRDKFDRGEPSSAFVDGLISERDVARVQRDRAIEQRDALRRPSKAAFREAMDQVEALREQLAAAQHELANERQVTQDLRERIAFDTRCERVAERLVFAMWIHAAYRIDSRGPSGCLMDALDIVAPDVAAAFREGMDGHDVYAKFYGSEDDEEDVVREEAGASTDTPIDEMLANLVGELHALRNAPTDPQGIASTVERLISATHGVAIAANDTRERLRRIERRIAAKDTER